MRYLLFISLLLLSFISCQKEELNEEIPEWLQPRIEELENSDYCFDCKVTRYMYNEIYYFHVYCGLWSCMYCELYDEQGNLVQSAQSFDFEDFLAKKTDELIVWSCPNSGS